VRSAFATDIIVQEKLVASGAKEAGYAMAEFHASSSGLKSLCSTITGKHCYQSLLVLSLLLPLLVLLLLLAILLSQLSALLLLLKQAHALPLLYTATAQCCCTCKHSDCVQQLRS
jgi:hypothetical protein